MSRGPPTYVDRNLESEKRAAGLEGHTFPNGSRYMRSGQPVWKDTHSRTVVDTCNLYHAATALCTVAAYERWKRFSTREGSTRRAPCGAAGGVVLPHGTRVRSDATRVAYFEYERRESARLSRHSRDLTHTPRAPLGTL